MSRDREKYNAYSKNYHQLHKDSRNHSARLKRLTNKLRAIEYLGSKCIDCKQTFHPAVFDFHHLNPDEKDFNLGSLMNWKWGKQQQELDKCILLCSNCHRMRHYVQ